MVLNRACGANADYLLNIIKIEKLVGIDTDRGHSHSTALNRNALALIKSGVAKHIANSVVANYIGEIGFGYYLCAQRIARHQNGFGKVAWFCGNMKKDVEISDLL